MWLDEAERETSGDYDRREENQFSETDFPIGPVKAEIESNAGEFADGKKRVEAGIDEKNFAEGFPTARPSRIKPAKVDGKAEREKDERVAPVSALLGIDFRGLHQEPGHERRKHGIKCEPRPAKQVLGSGDESVRKDEEKWCGQTNCGRPTIDQAGRKIAGEAERGRGHKLEYKHRNRGRRNV